MVKQSLNLNIKSNVIELFERLKRRDMGYHNGSLDGSDAQSPAASIGA